jgi:hypothetical protein
MVPRMVALVLAVLVAFALLHALGAAWLTFSGPRERLWERLALMSTLTTMLMALTLLVPAFLVPGFEANALALEGLCVFAVRRASPRFAARLMFLVLFVAPVAPLVGPAVERFQHRNHWHCLVPAQIVKR